MILQKNYNRDQFTDFITEFLPGINIDEREIKIADTKSSDIESAHLLGESRELDLKVFEIKHTGTSKRRVGLTMEGFQLMRSSGAFRALIAFYSQADEQWRFSLMTLTPKRNEKAKLTIERSSPKRYSFVLGPNSKTATPEKFLISKGVVSDFEDLQSRFSLEVVNKDFYKKISELFTKLVGGTIGNGKGKIEYEPLLKLPSIQDKSQTSLEFAVRLIGRVIFCWFLREKKSKDEVSLMPLSLLSHEAVKANENYYHSVLEPIFFEVLNKSIKERKEKFTQDGFNSIPYLNGGLFTPHYDDFFHYNEGKQAIFNNTVKVPDTWLQEFFEFLETYNFTIDENISFDEELSIDPEMLGRIFENLLAEINPETGESARKSTGSYYTPRTIVDYMVDESLYAYLDNKTGIDEEKIRAVISYDLGDDEEYPLNEEERKNITEALHQIKILDPACGSGAFPMGMLQKIVFILQQTDPDGKNWFKKQIQHASPEIRRAIEREFENKNFDYIRKLGIIRENIFGVDIQPIATEISRLRCFLTLIVDESIDDSAENRGIEPLPNLDFKFVTANTLIGLPQSAQSQQQANLFEDDAGIAELQELRDMFFNSTGAERDKLKFEFVQVQKRMLDHLIQSEIRGHAELTSKLTTWDPFSHQASSWFDPEWMFGVKEGFDVLITNPPYISFYSRQSQLDKYKDELEIWRKTYKFTNKKIPGRLNTIMFFIEKLLDLAKSEGIVSVIMDANFLESAYKFIRKYILERASIYYFIDKISVFENVNSDQVLLSIINTTPTQDHLLCFFPNFEKAQLNFCEKIPQNVFLKNKNFEFTLRDEEIFNSEIVPLEDMFDTVTGVQIGIGGSREYMGKEIIDLFYSETKIDKNYYPLISLASKDFFRYSNVKCNNFLNFNENLGYEINKNVPKCNIALPKYKDYICAEKLLVRQSSDSIVATYTDFCCIAEYSAFSIKQKNEGCSLKYLLGVINSKFITYYSRKNKIIKMGLKKQPQIRIKGLNSIPIKKPTQSEKKCIVDIVDKILLITKTQDFIQNTDSQARVKEFEKEIDQLVYELYNVTAEEIKIIEDSSKK